MDKKQEVCGCNATWQHTVGSRTEGQCVDEGLESAVLHRTQSYAVHSPLCMFLLATSGVDVANGFW